MIRAYLLSLFLLFTVELNASGLRSHPHPHHKRTRSACRARARSQNLTFSNNPADLWNKTADVRGQGFLDFFNFETQNTGSQGGIASYVSQEEAMSLQLAQVQNDVVRLSVDTTKQVQGTRKAIRMSTKSLLSAGNLVVVDVEHMPAACGAWPALWSVARDGSWPDKGEIDIIEGVNLFTQDAISVHTKSGFVMQEQGFSSSFMMSGDLKNNCGVYATNDQGCGLRANDTSTFGEPFNSAKGGVFVLDWTEDYISVFYFPRNSVPQDIAGGNPSKAASWRSSEPLAKFQDINGQKTSAYFLEHVLVINTNLCGAWPEGVWSADTSYAGQPQSCAQKTGYDSCSSYILNAGDQLTEAYWSIKSLQIYN